MLAPRLVVTRRTPNPKYITLAISDPKKAGANRENLIGFLHQLLPLRLKFLLGQKSAFS